MDRVTDVALELATQAPPFGVFCAVSCGDEGIVNVLVLLLVADVVAAEAVVARQPMVARQLADDECSVRSEIVDSSF